MQRVTRGGDVLLPAAQPDRLAARHARHLGIEPACDDAEWSARDDPHQARPSFRLESSNSTHPGDSWPIRLTVSDSRWHLSQLREAGIKVDVAAAEEEPRRARLRDLEGHSATLWQVENFVRHSSSPDESATRAIGGPPEASSPMTANPPRPGWRLWNPLVIAVVAVIAARPVAEAG